MAAKSLRESLRARLRTKTRMMRMARRGGTRQEVQQVLNKFNDGDEEKAALMRDIQQDVKGMKRKQANNYLKQVVKTMNPEQSDQFLSTVKQSMPGQSADIVNFVKQKQKEKVKEVESKVKVDPATVYVPAQVRRTQSESAPAADEKKVKKKKKRFAPVAVRVPKINQIGNGRAPAPAPAPSTPVSEKKVKLSSELEKIHQLFRRKKHVPWAKRIANLHNFDPAEQTAMAKQILLEAGEASEIVKPKEVQWLQVPSMVLVKGTSQPVEWSHVPVDFRRQLEVRSFAFGTDHPFVYQRAKEGKTVVRTLNAGPSVREFVSNGLEPVRRWLRSLVGRTVPWNYVVGALQDVGVVRAEGGQAWEIFHALGREIERPGQSPLTVKVPFAKIKVRAKQR